MSTPAVLIRLSNGAVLNPNGNLPVDPSIAVPGLDPDLRWLIKFTPFAPPDYDQRLFTLQTTQEITETPHPTYPLYFQYRTTYTTIKRASDQLLSNIANAEQAALFRIFPSSDQAKTLAMLGSLVLRLAEGIVLTKDEEDFKTKLVDLGASVSENSANSDRLKAAVAANEEPNLDDGWVVPDALTP